jgi:hypothetical protein
MIVTYFYTILELSIKSLKEGMRTPSLAEIGDKIQNWVQKKYNMIKQGAKHDFGPKLRVKLIWSLVCAH